jgi:lipid A 3-O-deacylase
LKRASRYRIIWFFILAGLVSPPLSASETAWRSVGLRGGVNDHRNDEDFEQYEAFSTWNLPWFWNWDSGWALGTYLEANAGVLSGGGDSAFVGSIGPGLYISGFREMVEISMGINPTIISKHKFGDENLGGPIEFTSHIGLNFIFDHHYSIGYRLQHMSNAVLYEHNPGLNMHMIGVGYRF